MLKKYWKIALAAAFLAVAGLVFGFTGRSDMVLLPEETGGPAVFGLAPDSDGSAAAGAVLGENIPGSGQNAEMTVEAGTVPETTVETTAEAANCYVYVCGEVASPGVYMLPEGSRIFEAIDAAGGFTEAAASRSLNLAAPVSDGMQITVLSQEEAETLSGNFGIGETGGSAASAGSSGLVNINTATKEELMTLPGIGSARAEDIIRYRQESGGFKTIEDIMKVSGIKDAAFQKIKDSITV